MYLTGILGDTTSVSVVLHIQDMATSSGNSARRRSSIKKTVKDQSGAGRIKVGELLSKAGYITATQFETAKKEVRKAKEGSGKINTFLIIK